MFGSRILHGGYSLLIVTGLKGERDGRGCERGHIPVSS